MYWYVQGQYRVHAVACALYVHTMLAMIVKDRTSFPLPGHTRRHWPRPSLPPWWEGTWGSSCWWRGGRTSSCWSRWTRRSWWLSTATRSSSRRHLWSAGVEGLKVRHPWKYIQYSAISNIVNFVTCNLNIICDSYIASTIAVSDIHHYVTQSIHQPLLCQVGWKRF